MGTSVSLPAVWESWSRHFASTARNDLNFMARLLNQISFFAILSLVSIKWYIFLECSLQRKIGSERFWRLMKHWCVKRIDQSVNAYYVQLCYEKWYVRRENSDFSFTQQLTAIQAMCALRLRCIVVASFSVCRWKQENSADFDWTFRKS